MTAPTTLPVLTPHDPAFGARVVEIAHAEWASVVREPSAATETRELAAIRSYIDAVGGPPGYDADGDWQWCGAFAAWCLIRAGVEARPLRQKAPPEDGGLGSHYRAWCLGQRFPSTLITRWQDVQAGDVVIVGRSGKSKWGEHLTLATGPSVEPDAGPIVQGPIPTFEGNATGKLGNGVTGEGVVKRSRLTIPTTTAKGFVFGLRIYPGSFA